MENEQTLKEKIILVLQESIRVGRKSNFVYDIMLEKHKEIFLITKIRDVMNEKILLFKNIDENSELFRNIHDTAKLALRKLQDDGNVYNFYSAELILKFNKLENIFSKRLKSLGTREVIKQQSNTTVSIEEEIDETTENEFDNEKNIESIDALTKTAKFIDSETTGKKFLRKVREKKEIQQILTNNQL